jgi:hypothetical protein
MINMDKFEQKAKPEQMPNNQLQIPVNDDIALATGGDGLPLGFTRLQKAKKEGAKALGAGHYFRTHYGNRSFYTNAEAEEFINQQRLLYGETQDRDHRKPFLVYSPTYGEYWEKQKKYITDDDCD